MKLFEQSIGLLFAIGLGSALTDQAAGSHRARLVDRCCQVGKERAIEDAKFNCKLGAREALVSGHQGRDLLAMSADLLLTRDASFADQCEMVLESCCLAHHRSKNCDSGKQFAKSGAACMDVELSKEATLATESFNDCCMSCSLGILAARNPAQNETSPGRAGLSARCKLISPLANSLSGQLYEQTYVECCQENLPRASSALLEPGATIDCAQYNPCSQRCVTAGLRFEQDRCDCFAGYKLSGDGVTCVDIDECKSGAHTCNRKSEVCDNTRGSFRCLARQSDLFPEFTGSSRSEELGLGPYDDVTTDLRRINNCPTGYHFDQSEARCLQDGVQRSASLMASSNLRLISSSSHLVES